MPNRMNEDTISRIFELVDQKYAEQRNFAADLQIAQSVISAWRKRKSLSYNKRLPEIANLLGTTVEYLVTGNLTPPEAPLEEIERAAKALKLFESLPPDKQPSALEYMEFLLAQGGDKDK